MSAKLAGAASVVLSDMGLADAPTAIRVDTLPRGGQLIDNLALNARANGLSDSIEVRRNGDL